MPLTPSQIAWAAEHDWFVRDNGNGTIRVADRWVIDGKDDEAMITWEGSFRELRAWAGY